MIETAAAKLYGISIERLPGILITNPERIPDDFLFILEDEERDEIKKSNPKDKSLIAFTDAGIIMLSGLVGNKKSLKVLVYIIKWAARNPDLLEGEKDIKELISVMNKMNELKLKDEISNKLYELLPLLNKLKSDKNNIIKEHAGWAMEELEKLKTPKN